MDMLEKAIRLWNPWWASGKVDEARLGIRRDLTDEVIKLLDSKHIKDMVGVRRCGKTTVLFQVIDHLLKRGTRPKEILFLNFDDIQISNSNFAEILHVADRLDPDTKFLFLDEVQLKKGWEKWVRSLYDTGRFEQIFVTGSSSSVLSTDIGRVLTGRHLTFRLFPFSFKEFLKFNDWRDFAKDELLANSGRMAHFLDRYLIEGGFPEVIGKDEFERKAILTNLYNDIIIRDVVSRYNAHRDIVANIAFYLISNVCNEYSLRRISNALDCSVETVSRYLDFLKEAELFQSLRVFSYKLKQQFKQNKKIYCIDTGLIDSVAHGQRDIGKLMENAVHLELLRRKNEVNYWKGNKQKEVDFVIKNKAIRLFQVCKDLKGMKTREREIGSLLIPLKKFKKSSGTIITLDEEGSEKVGKRKIAKTPLWRFLLGI